MDVYAYTPLSTPKSIRLAYLHGGTVEEPLSIDIEEVDTTLDPEYTALSYVWGATHGSVPISCANKSILITPNLEQALRYLRSPTDTRRLWIDALCINQKDTKEKNHQVAMMRDIYRGARSTAMYIGNEGPDTEAAFGIIPNLCNIIQEHMGHLKQNELFSITLPNPGAFPELNFEDERPVQGLTDMLNRPYFTRAWIVQEIATSKNPFIICGRFETPWSYFQQAVAIAGANGITNISSLRLRISHGIVGDLFSWSLRPVRSLSGVAGMFQTTRASDPRDKIYAFLGLTTITEATKAKSSVNLVADYNKTVQEVYTEASRYILSEAASLSFWDTSHHPTKSKIPSLPSWVPDWSYKPDPRSFWDPSAYGLKDLIKYDPYVESTSLFIDGCVVDRVFGSISIRSWERFPIVVAFLVLALDRLDRTIFDNYPRGICASGTENSLESSLQTIFGFLQGQGHGSITGYPSLNLEAFWMTVTRDVAREQINPLAQGPGLESVFQVIGLIIAEGNLMDFTELAGFARQLDHIKELERAISEYVRTDVDFYITEKGYFGIADLDEVKKGMTVAILGGARACWILEENKSIDEHWFKMVGQTYMVNVDGMTELEDGAKVQRMEIR